MEEIRHALRVGRYKAPVSHGIGLELYKANRMTCALPRMRYTWRKLSPRNKEEGVIVCLPKISGLKKPNDLRPLIKLNADYILLARILETRLRPLLAEQLQTTKFCGVPGNTILEAVATVREAIAQAEEKRSPTCVLSLDFKEVFDRISHQYLFTLLQSYGLSDWFIYRVRSVYAIAFSLLQINGHIAGPIPIRCSIRQECSMSLVLFSLCINTLLKLPDTNLVGVCLGRSSRRTAVVTYTDDVSIVVTKANEFRVIRDAVRLYEEASESYLYV